MCVIEHIAPSHIVRQIGYEGITVIRATNLISFVSIRDSEAEEHCLRFLDTKCKTTEIENIRSFCNDLNLYEPISVVACFSNFFIGFKIPQISKEFDLLRIGDDCVINIELKSRYTDKICHQLKQNKHYLSFLQKEMRLFTYCASNSKIYTLNDHDNLIEAEFEQLFDTLKDQTNIFHGDLTNLFNPSVFLVSPFNSTDRFLNDEYFLTAQQEEITAKVQKVLDEKSFHIVSIKGNAGTGKSLLLYHIAKKLTSVSPDILIIHGGKLNDGQRKLIESGWRIEPVKSILPLFDDTSTVPKLQSDGSVIDGKEYTQAGVQKYAAILVDEAQRITERQLNLIIRYAEKNQALCIFSHDPAQILNYSERTTKISETLEEMAHNKSTLTKSIRTNKEIIAFIDVIFGKKHGKICPSKNTRVVFFKAIEWAAAYISSKVRDGWKYISHTPQIDKYRIPSKYDPLLDIAGSENAHRVIGQEFDNVIAVVYDTFYYDDDGILQSHALQDDPYPKRDTFFQAITRARQQLEIVIVDNIMVYKEMLSKFE
jgi:hypothetical protein